jgi:putative Ca2+/H+ antiporter (TMEM165/GDT1 family)
MGALLLAFGVVFVAELGDKTQLVVLTLAVRQRVAAVLAGLAVTIALLQALAVSVGASISAVVPGRALEIAAGVLFFGFAWWTWRNAGRVEPDELAGTAPRERSGVLGVCTAFFLAELGDKTQLSTATLAADHGAIATWIGATAGLFGASVLALGAGRVLASRVSARLLGRIGAGAFAFAGAVSLVAALRG